MRGASKLAGCTQDIRNMPVSHLDYDERGRYGCLGSIAVMAYIEVVLLGAKCNGTGQLAIYSPLPGTTPTRLKAPSPV